jgi:hypothetical protein
MKSKWWTGRWIYCDVTALNSRALREAPRYAIGELCRVVICSARREEKR